MTTTEPGVGDGARRRRPGTEGRPLSPADIGLVRALIRRTTGIELSSQEYLIRQRLGQVADRFDLLGAWAVVDRLRQGDCAKLEAEVVDAMTTNVTSFFRDPELFDCLADRVLPELVDRCRTLQRPLVVWSGACSSGQEVVSLAILVLERFPELVGQGLVRLVATDVSPAMVARTLEGAYSEPEVAAGLADQRLARWFVRRDHRWVTVPAVRDLIEARTVNLLRPLNGVPRSDLVLLRNVLIYFSPENRNDVLQRVRSGVIAPGGSLLLGGSERGLFSMTDAGFEADRLPGATRYLPV